ncbi:glycoside hydrolase family protein [Alistipes indistinctus]|uniref:glycoside hydrolase family protein n=1 Tax=Alistipes indistinctus TaxID=626932 RepID=UPI003A84E90B
MRRMLVTLMCLLGACTPTTDPASVPVRLVAEQVALMDEAVALIKRYEGWHTENNYPYVGYGHRLQPGETFNARITEETADSLLRADLKQKCAVFRRFGRDSLLLGVLAYNIGEYRLLGYGTRPKSRLVEKLEAGERDIRAEYVSFRKWQGRVVPSIERRRKEEFELLYGKTKITYRYENDDTTRK